MNSIFEENALFFCLDFLIISAELSTEKILNELIFKFEITDSVTLPVEQPRSYIFELLVG